MNPVTDRLRAIADAQLDDPTVPRPQLELPEPTQRERERGDAFVGWMRGIGERRRRTVAVGSSLAGAREIAGR